MKIKANTKYLFQRAFSALTARPLKNALQAKLIRNIKIICCLGIIVSFFTAWSAYPRMMALPTESIGYPIVKRFSEVNLDSHEILSVEEADMYWLIQLVKLKDIENSDARRTLFIASVIFFFFFIIELIVLKMLSN